MASNQYNKITPNNDVAYLNGHVSSVKSIEDFILFTATDPLASISNLVNIRDNGTGNLDYTVTSSTSTAWSEYHATKDYCYAGLILNRGNGCMYLGNSSTYSKVLLFDLTKVLSKLIETHLGVAITVMPKGLDGFLQMCKLNEKDLPRDLAILINNSPGKFTTESTLGRLLLGEADSSKVGVKTQDVEPKFSIIINLMNAFIVTYADKFIRAMADLDVETKSVMNTTSMMCKAIRHVVDEEGWMGVRNRVVNNPGEEWTVELSTNPLFNPSARTIIQLSVPSDLKEPAVHNKHGADRVKYCKLVNAADLLATEQYGGWITNSLYKDVNKILDSQISPDFYQRNVRDGYVDYRAENTGIKLLRVNAINAGYAAIDNMQARTVSGSIQKSIDELSVNQQDFYDPAAFSLDNRTLSALIRLIGSFK